MSAEAERRAAVQQAIGADEIAALTNVRDQIISMREVSRSLAANAELFADNRGRCQATLERISDQHENVTISVLDAEGDIVCAEERRLVGQRVSAAALLATSAARVQSVIGFDGGKAAFIAVSPAELRPAAGDLYVGVTRAAEPLLELNRNRQPVSGDLIVDGAGAVLFSRGFDAESGEGRDVRRLLAETPPALLSNAQRIGETWLVATELEQGSLYIVHGWRPAPPTLLDNIRSAWTLLAPILLWLAAIAAAWYAIELFVARPLLIVERLARAYARGEDSEDDEEMLRTAPLEMRSLRRTLAAMAKTLRGREARISEALQEERVLLREVHHRVKNNLQMVASILSIQARSADDEAEARGLARAKDRVQMLALAHARIYASGEVRDISLDQLAGDIARQMIAGRGAAASHLRLDLTLDSVHTDIDRAVAYAFLIGESVSNAIDHALGLQDATLNVSLRVQGDGSLEFEVTCTPKPVDGAPAPAAQRLIDAFASQLGARVVREAGDPISTRIVVPPETEPAASLTPSSTDAAEVK